MIINYERANKRWIIDGFGLSPDQHRLGAAGRACYGNRTWMPWQLSWPLVSIPYVFHATRERRGGTHLRVQLLSLTHAAVVRPAG